MTAPQITRAAGRPKGFPADVAARWGAWRDLHGKGFSVAQIAKRHGVHRKAVYHAKARNWRPSYGHLVNADFVALGMRQKWEMMQ